MRRHGNPDNGFRGPEGICHGLRRKNDKCAVNPLIPDDGSQRIFITILGRVPDDIHWIMEICRGRKVAREALHRFFAEFGKAES